MHLSVGGELERAHHRRLVMAGLFAPLLMAAALVQTLASQLGGVAILALVSAVIGPAWLAVTLLAVQAGRGSPRSSCFSLRRFRARP